MADVTTFACTSVVLIAVYVLIAVRKVGKYSIPAYMAATAGALAVLAIGAVSPESAWSFIDWDVIGLLFGMMLMAAALDRCGFFDLVASWMESRFPEKRGFLVAVMLITSALCMVILNDAVILIFTPIVMVCCRRMKADPVPYVIAVFTAANIGCAATFVGAPHCALAGSFGGISFTDYAVRSIPVVVICTLVAAWMFRRHFARDLCSDCIAGGDSDARERFEPGSRMYVCLAILATVLVLFALDDVTGFGLGPVSVVGGIIAAVTACSYGGSAPRYVVEHVNWGILLFFVSLFVLIAGVRDAGVIDAVASACGMDSGSVSIPQVAFFTTVLSNLVSNVPAVALVGQMVAPAGPEIWTTLAVISSFCANLTIIGAAANLIGIGEAEKQGVTVTFMRHFRAGAPVAIVTCIIAVVYLEALSVLL